MSSPKSASYSGTIISFILTPLSLFLSLFYKNLIAGLRILGTLKIDNHMLPKKYLSPTY